MGRVLALDPGEKRIGIAISDPTCTIPKGMGWVGPAEVVERVRELIKEKDVDVIVIGYPLDTFGKVGKRAQMAEELAVKLQQLGVDVVLWDERFSTHEAQRMMREMGLKPSKLKGKTDEQAAMVILEGYLWSLEWRKGKKG